MSRVWREDLGWAGVLLGLGMIVGLVLQGPLVRQSWRGELAALLDQAREQRRQQQFQGVQTINLEQAYARFQAGQARFLDARPPEEYAELHIAGALNITPSMLEGKGTGAVPGLAKDQEMVVYCGQVDCDLSLQVAEKLQAWGFTRVRVYLGGFRAWDEAGYPADTSK